jgi:hypothetical protein
MSPAKPLARCWCSFMVEQAAFCIAGTSRTSASRIHQIFNQFRLASQHRKPPCCPSNFIVGPPELRRIHNGRPQYWRALNSRNQPAARFGRMACGRGKATRETQIISLSGKATENERSSLSPGGPRHMKRAEPSAGSLRLMTRDSLGEHVHEQFFSACRQPPPESGDAGARLRDAGGRHGPYPQRPTTSLLNASSPS